MMKKYKKAQMALEFLTTYGWAFLVIFIMISTLAYFGILNPSKLLPDRCTLGSEFECQDFLLDATNGKMLLRLKSNTGTAINITTFKVSSETKFKFSCETLPESLLLSSGDVVDLTFGGFGPEGDCDFIRSGMMQGDKGKVLISFTYYNLKNGPNYPHDVHGEVYATIK